MLFEVFSFAINFPKVTNEWQFINYKIFRNFFFPSLIQLLSEIFKILIFTNRASQKIRFSSVLYLLDFPYRLY